MSSLATLASFRNSLFRGAIVLGIVGLGLSLGHSLRADDRGYRTLFDDAFDDDPLGSSPEGVASGEQEVVTSASGTIVGQKVGSTTAVSVIREPIDPEGNCLSLTDNGGEGFARVQFFPQFTTSGAKSEIAFDLRRSLNVGETSFVFSVIDNRTTPGTGRLCTLSMFGDQPLAVNSKNSGYRIQPDVTYRVEISLDLALGPQDSWSVKITNLSDPTQVFESVGLRTLIDGSELSSFSITVDAVDGATTFDIDNVLAIAY